MGDLLGLVAHCYGHATRAAIEAHLGAVEADFQQRRAHDVANLHIGGRVDLAHHVHKAGGDHGFHGHARLGVLRQERIQDVV